MQWVASKELKHGIAKLSTMLRDTIQHQTPGLIFPHFLMQCLDGGQLYSMMRLYWLEATMVERRSQCIIGTL